MIKRKLIPSCKITCKHDDIDIIYLIRSPCEMNIFGYLVLKIALVTLLSGVADYEGVSCRIDILSH